MARPLYCTGWVLLWLPTSDASSPGPEHPLEATEARARWPFSAGDQPPLPVQPRRVVRVSRERGGERLLRVFTDPITHYACIVRDAQLRLRASQERLRESSVALALASEALQRSQALLEHERKRTSTNFIHDAGEHAPVEPQAPYPPETPSA